MAYLTGEARARLDAFKAVTVKHARLQEVDRAMSLAKPYLTMGQARKHLGTLRTLKPRLSYEKVRDRLRRQPSVKGAAHERG